MSRNSFHSIFELQLADLAKYNVVHRVCLDDFRPPEGIRNTCGTFFMHKMHPRSALDTNFINRNGFSRIWSTGAEHPIHSGSLTSLPTTNEESGMFQRLPSPAANHFGGTHSEKVLKYLPKIIMKKQILRSTIRIFSSR